MSVDPASIAGEIEAAVAETRAADAKASAILTAAGLVAAGYTAAATVGRQHEGVVTWLIVAGVAAIVASLLLLLIALRPRIPSRCDIRLWYGPYRRGDHPSDERIVAELARIAWYKHRRIRVATDSLIVAIALGGMALVYELLT